MGAATHAGPAAELTNVPFFPQETHQCGPAALATVLGASGAAATPHELVPLVYLPQRRGSLQTELIAAARRYERLPYALDGTLEAIATEVRAGRPVLVLQNLGLRWLARWHYAVVVGVTESHIVLRSGREQRLALRHSSFLRTWSHAASWAIVLLRPGEMPAAPDSGRWLSASAAFEKVASDAATLANYEAAAREWPYDPMMWLGLGNARYRTGNLAGAEEAFRRAVELDGEHAPALNNLAQTLAERGCRAQAIKYLERARLAATDALLPAIETTESEIALGREAPSGGASCID